jgi:hypothetical protein
LNDHKALRLDVAMQTAVGVDREVASASTLCRLESWAGRATAVRLSGLLVERFIASFKTVPAELVLDPVPGPRVDRNQARSPSRGGGNCALTAAIPHPAGRLCICSATQQAGSGPKCPVEAIQLDHGEYPG